LSCTVAVNFDAFISGRIQATIKQKIAQLNFEIKEMEIKMKPLLAEREVISDKVTKGRSLVARLKKSLTKFR
jgi:hypothetical protein